MNRRSPLIEYLARSPMRRSLRRLRRSPMRRSPMRRSPYASPYYTGYVTNWVSEKTPKCKTISSAEFDDLDSLGVHEFDRNRCYDPDYDLNPDNQGDRSDYVKWAFMKNLPVILIPDSNDKFPYEDIEYKIIMDRYFENDYSELRDKRYKFYISMLNEMLDRKRELYNGETNTILQSKIKKILKRHQHEHTSDQVLIKEIEDKILSRMSRDEIQKKINSFFPRLS